VTKCRCRFHMGCTVHDDDGRRWDSYTAEEVARLDRQKVEPAQAEWNCYCGRHEATDDYADFRYVDENGKTVVEDAKGRQTDAFRIKRHLMKSVHNIDVRLS